MLYEVSVIVLIAFAALAGVYAALGVILSSRMPWTKGALGCHLPLAVGIASAPFLFAFAGVLVLGLMPGRAHAAHVAVVVFLPVFLIFALARRERTRAILASSVEARGFESRVGALAVAGAFILLVASAAALPLTQNDALEYFTVAREMFATRRLDTYPLMNPESNLTGFFAPWTHPPLYNCALYAAQLLQGNADFPGVGRLVSTWFAGSAVYLTSAVGSLVIGKRGFVAAMILASTPLFFLGADSALIDSLPVLGFLLFTAAFLGLDVTRISGGAVTGAFLGISLWTHSTAVLYPMFFVGLYLLFSPWNGLRASARPLIAGLLVALLVALWPYLRNVLVFGVPVSDQPLVFALPQLRFSDYFQTGRGLGSAVATVQYGVFKGWFSLEAYAWAFWLLLAGIVGLVRHRRSLFPSFRHRTAPPSLQQSCLVSAAFVVAAYLAGVALTTAFGIYELIKNERYMLVILPHVCIVGAAGIVALVERAPRSNWLRRSAAGLLAYVLLAQVGVLVFYRFTSNGVSPLERPASPMSILDRRAEHQVTRFLREETPNDAVVLSFKPADMYYASRRQISYLDPRMVPVYNATDPAAAAAILHSLGVRFIHVPDYGLPPLYNSIMTPLLRDPQFSVIASSGDFNQVYELRDRSASERSVHDMKVAGAAWVDCYELKVGGRKGFASLPLVGSDAWLAVGAAFSRIGFFSRDLSRVHRMGTSCSQRDGRSSTRVTIVGGREYGLSLALDGRALVKIWSTYWRDERPVTADFDRSRSPALFGELISSAGEGIHRYGRRFRSLPSADAVSFDFEIFGDPSVNIVEAKLDEITDGVTNESAPP